MEISELLQSIGIRGNQADVYLKLVHLGRATASDIARQTGIKRPTVYDSLGELQAKGLISIAPIGSRRCYIAEDPKVLHDLARRYQHTIRNLVPQLQTIYHNHIDKPHFHMYEGAEGIRRVFEDLLTVKNGNYCYFGSAGDMIDALGADYLADYVERRVKRKIHSRAIRIANKERPFPPLSSSQRYLREVRYIQQPIAGDLAALFIYDGRVGVISTARENYGLVMASRDLASLLQILWDCMWKQVATTAI